MIKYEEDNIVINYTYDIAYTFAKYLFSNFSHEEVFNILKSAKSTNNDFKTLFNSAKEWSLSNKIYK